MSASAGPAVTATGSPLSCFVLAPIGEEGSPRAVRRASVLIRSSSSSSSRSALRSDSNQRGLITRSFWHACRGGQQPVAEYLIDHGADLNWVGHDGKTPCDVAHESSDDHPNSVATGPRRQARGGIDVGRGERSCLVSANCVYIGVCLVCSSTCPTTCTTS
jgi:hypothetical protein